MGNLNQCRICGSDGPHQSYIFNEIMYGTNESFDYFECNCCGCLQICKIPEDLSKYYPMDYLSLADEHIGVNQKSTNLKQVLRRSITNHRLGHYSVLGLFADKLTSDYFDYPWSWFSGLGLRHSSRILDIGCGNGRFLYALQLQGFKRLTGVDPHIAEDIVNQNIFIHKKQLNELEGEFDYIMMHHSLEHMPDQLSVISEIDRLLSNNGSALIRVPIKAKPFEIYKQSWVGLDAPRHLYTHTEQSVERLFENSNLLIKNVVYDSTGFHLWASEQIQKGIFLTHKKSFWSKGVTINESIFSSNQIEEFNKKAVEQNMAGLGGQACFYIMKKNSEHNYE